MERKAAISLMESQPQKFSLARRLVFPANGNDELTPGQSKRIIATWAILFTIPLVLMIFLVVIFAGISLQRAVIWLAGAIVLGFILFGFSAWASIKAYNQAVRAKIRHEQEKASSTQRR
jgi:positive regulator of sigma E activity